MIKNNSKPMWRRAASIITGSILLTACSPLTTSKAPSTSTSSLCFIGEQRLPWRQPFQGTLVGGLSGIDYDAASGEWILIADDRSAINPARYYRARLSYDEHLFKSAELTGVTELRQPDGSTYPSAEEYKQRGGVVPDLETIRIDPRDGRYLAELPLPAMFGVSADHTSGPRDNLSFEGMSFAPAR